jgi:hypothetical protein
MHHDLAHCAKVVNGLTSVASATAEEITGEIVDTKDFESGIVSAVVTAWTAGEFKINRVLESDDSGMAGATVIPDQQIIDDTGVGVSAIGTKSIGFVRNKRYIQPVYETVGGSVTGTVQGVVVLGHSVETVEV